MYLETVDRALLPRRLSDFEPLSLWLRSHGFGAIGRVALRAGEGRAVSKPIEHQIEVRPLSVVYPRLIPINPFIRTPAPTAGGHHSKVSYARS
jgi:hypothetical protein